MSFSTSPIKWPIIGTWQLEGHPETYEGVLFAENGEANLRIFLEIPPPAVQAICPDVEGFVATVVRVRNVLTHRLADG
jgi:hypothetical protein